MEERRGGREERRGGERRRDSSLVGDHECW